MGNDGNGAIAQKIIDHPITALAAPTVTAVAGHLSVLAEAQQWITFFSTLVGLLVSIVLLKNHWLKGRQLELQLKEHDHVDRRMEESP